MIGITKRVIIFATTLILTCTLPATESQAACWNSYGPEVTIIPRSATTFSFYYRDLDYPTSHEFRLRQTQNGGSTYEMRITWDFTIVVRPGWRYRVYLVGVNTCGQRNTSPILVWSR